MCDKTAKFKIRALVMVPVLVFFASCEFPQSARIKASPTLQIPIPLGEGTDNSFIRSYTDIDEIKGKLEGDTEEGKGISIYEYDSGALMTHFNIERPEESEPAQTYLITYPLFDMSLDFDKYLNGTLLDTDKSRVPEVDISIEISKRTTDDVERAAQWGNLESGDLPYWNWIDPFMGNPPEVDLGDMKNLVSDITFESGTGFSIKVTPANAEKLKKAIRVRVPQIKIGGATDTGEDSWAKGELNGDRTKLVFRSTGIDPDEPLLLLNDEPDQWKKRASEKIELQVRLVNVIDAGSYKTELDFKWYSAKVKPNNEEPREFKGFNLGSFLNSLGDNAKFERVPAYLYVDTPVDGFTVEIGAGVVEESFPLQKGDVKGEGLLSWLNKLPASEYDFTTTLNAGKSITYAITSPPTVEVFRSEIEAQNDPKITVNLAVLLPMIFRFSGNGTVISDDPDTEENEGGTYFPVKFQGLDDFLGTGDGDDDDDDDKSVMDEIDEQLGEGSITRLTLRLTDIDNKVTSAIYLAVKIDPKKDDWKTVKIAAGAKDRDIDIENVKSLTGLPPIKFLVKDEGGQGGRLYIQSQTGEDSAAFSVKISVVAGINVDNPIDL
jgi:hypothetical protein